MALLCVLMSQQLWKKSLDLQAGVYHFVIFLKKLLHFLGLGLSLVLWNSQTRRSQQFEPKARERHRKVDGGWPALWCESVTGAAAWWHVLVHLWTTETQLTNTYWCGPAVRKPQQHHHNNNTTSLSYTGRPRAFDWAESINHILSYINLLFI